MLFRALYSTAFAANLMLSKGLSDVPTLYPRRPAGTPRGHGRLLPLLQQRQRALAAPPSLSLRLVRVCSEGAPAWSSCSSSSSNEVPTCTRAESQGAAEGQAGVRANAPGQPGRQSGGRPVRCFAASQEAPLDPAPFAPFHDPQRPSWSRPVPRLSWRRRSPGQPRRVDAESPAPAPSNPPWRSCRRCQCLWFCWRRRP